MPQRVIQLWMVVAGLVGLLLVAVLVVFGADLVRASRTGPRWKRRLVAAALALLSGAGAGLAGRDASAAEHAAAPAPAKAPAAAQDDPLAQTPQWQRLTATWKEADEVASGRKGEYPFDAAGKKALLAALADRAKDADALAAKDLLTEPEAGLLRKELDRLTEGVQRMRPTEMRMATCYKPMPPPDWPYYSLTRLKARVELLGGLADAKVLHPGVVRKLLAAVEADIRNVENPGTRTWMLDGPAARETLGQVKPLAEKIRARLGEVPGAQAAGLEATAQWKAVIEAWRFCKPLADSHRSTTAQRKGADEKLAAAKQAVVQLANDGAISAPEGGLLVDEADAIRQDIYRDPPTDSKVTCYDMAYNPPAWVSLTRLTKRLGLLEKLARSGKVSPAVIGKVLPAVQADLATLADPKQAQTLQGDKAAQAAATTAAVKAAIEKIQKLLPAEAAKGS